MLPSPALYEGIVGQERVVEQLRRASSHPVHAYLFTGPPGTGKRRAALGLAASLLCPNGGDGTCRVCRQVLAGTHIDVMVVERSGAYIRVEEAREIGRIASLTPVDAPRKVLILADQSQTGYALTSKVGDTRIAWKAGTALPVVQCITVSRTGNAISGLTVRLLAIGGQIPSESDCARRYDG